MAKDPAVLFYIDSWLVSTAEMEADCRGWYLNLLLHNYDKGSLPNDIEQLAVLCNVRFSEFERFKHVFEHMLKHKFKLNNEQRLENPKTTEILQKRNDFKESRSTAGKVSYMMRYFAKNFAKEFKDQSLKAFIKENLNLSIDTKNEHMLEHMFKHLFELYINRNEDKNKDIDIDKNEVKEKGVAGEKTWREDFEVYCDSLRNMYKQLLNDAEYIKQQQEFHPNLDIPLTLKKACVEYWATETAWKKKKRSSTKEIDWKATLTNALNQSFNKVYKQNEPTRSNSSTETEKRNSRKAMGDLARQILSESTSEDDTGCG